MSSSSVSVDVQSGAGGDVSGTVIVGSVSATQRGPPTTTPTDPNYILEIRTAQASTFRSLIEGQKEFLVDVNWQVDTTGIRVFATDEREQTFCHLKLYAERFEFFYIANNMTLGINMLSLFRLVKTIGNQDTLTLFVDKTDINRLGIRIESVEKNKVTTYRLKLMDVDSQSVVLPPTRFPYAITMPSGDFQKLCRDLSQVGDTVRIKSQGNELIFICRGDSAEQETVIGETDGGLSITKREDPGSIIQDEYDLKYLQMFTKCTSLSNSVEIYMKKDFPLLIRYTVGNLGEIKLCLAAKSTSA